MKRYGIDEIRAALRELDGMLDGPAKVTLIGGAAVALILDDRRLVTKDIDAFGISRSLLQLARGLQISIDAAGVADLPWNFEDRLSVVLRLTNLEVHVPEPHDLVLSKVMRWSHSDEEHARRLHAHRALDEEVLIHRYLTEMTHVIGEPSRIRSHLLGCIDTLFGEAASRRAEVRIPSP